ncbi:MAG: transcriptional regulator [Alphaproteobacteria bacterium]|nr:transcriptional regulator [Alphaproteobacteria bacterium]|tara:strand:- start:100 stop:528 length:429 start_codon:yes stop_codon:yes gene_type:complete
MSDTGNLSSPRGGKSAGAFRTISEVATDLDVPQHVLRFWETKFNQVRPMKRGGGRRYYRPEDVDLLRSIRSLLYDDGYTIKGVQKLLREGELKPAAAEAAPASAAPPAKPAPAPAPAGTTAEERSELKSILGELEALRKLLD